MNKILIVEDEPALLRSLSDELRFNGFQVVEARDGEAGLKQALNNKEVCLAVLDLMLPKVDGIDVLKQIRAHSERSNLPVIILTNKDADNDIVTQIPALNPCFYLMKHEMTPMFLISKIKECLAPTGILLTDSSLGNIE